ncbi:hypothetical protein SAY87_004575 [Trapa incisa]|uniref:Uncharacterized protein n=1 Tax=Trapa incisa TaxID=236973 RepID=A0AAN7JQ45_9MYRT|nr:hypothetical protein SAY87_004575 [Trapa incisa]
MNMWASSRSLSAKVRHQPVDRDLITEKNDNTMRKENFMVFMQEEDESKRSIPKPTRASTDF